MLLNKLVMKYSHNDLVNTFCYIFLDGSEHEITFHATFKRIVVHFVVLTIIAFR